MPDSVRLFIEGDVGVVGEEVFCGVEGDAEDVFCGVEGGVEVVEVEFESIGEDCGVSRKCGGRFSQLLLKT